MTLQLPTVFVVDDDPVQVFFLSGILRTAGHRVEAFEQPEALLARLSASNRGCVVLDLQMPGLSGLELQRALEGRGVTLPLIFVSGHADVTAAVTAMKQGAVDFLPKPVDPKELCAVVARALRKDTEAAAERGAIDLARTRWAALSAREREVCRLFSRGMLNKQIATVLGTAESTVRALLLRALQNLQVNTVAALVRLMEQASDEG